MTYPEKQKPILTKKGVERKAPKHRKAAIGLSYQDTLRHPLIPESKFEFTEHLLSEYIKKYPQAMEYFISEVIHIPIDDTQKIVQKINDWAKEEGTTGLDMYSIYDEKWFKEYQDRARNEKIASSPVLKYLSVEFDKRNSALDTAPIKLNAESKKTISEAMEFARDHPVSIDLIFNKVNVLIHYRHRDKDGVPGNLELSIRDKEEDVLYYNNDYDINLMPDDVLRIVKQIRKP